VSPLNLPASGKKGLTEETGTHTAVPPWQRPAEAAVARKASSGKVYVLKIAHNFLQLLSNADLGNNFKISG